MEKRFCDRCGTEIVGTKRTMLDAVNDAMEQLKVNFGGKHRIKYNVQIIDLDDPNISRPTSDLCEQCEKDLISFMNEKKGEQDE